MGLDYAGSFGGKARGQLWAAIPFQNGNNGTRRPAKARQVPTHPITPLDRRDKSDFGIGYRKQFVGLLHCVATSHC